MADGPIRHSRVSAGTLFVECISDWAKRSRKEAKKICVKGGGRLSAERRLQPSCVSDTDCCGVTDLRGLNCMVGLDLPLPASSHGVTEEGIMFWSDVPGVTRWRADPGLLSGTAFGVLMMARAEEQRH